MLDSLLMMFAALEWPLAIVALVVGACIGSFLNVCIHRLPLDESVVAPRSRCPGCGTTIAWYDNIPVLSWLLLRARCRTCQAPIAARYPLVELSTGGLAVIALAIFGPTAQALVAFAFTAALLCVTFIDVDHFIIPDEVSLPGLVIGLAVAGLPSGIGLANAALGALLGGGILWAVAAGYEWLTDREGMGFGDVKLLAMIGAFLGWQAVPLVLVAASVSGSLAGVAVMLGQGLSGAGRRVVRQLGAGALCPFVRRAAQRTAIPFGPFLALGAVLALYIPAWHSAWGL
jgi:leader peptidase (prepilin peptidase) / N-methyltransferase